jgi:hypothetical protein
MKNTTDHTEIPDLMKAIGLDEPVTPPVTETKTVDAPLPLPEATPVAA